MNNKKNGERERERGAGLWIKSERHDYNWRANFLRKISGEYFVIFLNVTTDIIIIISPVIIT